MKISLFALRRGATLFVSMLLAVALAACAADGGDTSGDSSTGATASVTGGSVEITAENIEFDATAIEAPAGEPFTITLVNNDSALHNISVYTEKGGEAIVEGAYIEQGETVDVEVPALEAGEYYFVCDLHPSDMEGTLTAG